MKFRITFDSSKRCVVAVEPSWFDSLRGRSHDPRYAECSGWGRTWFWCSNQRAVPDDIELAIDRAWQALSPEDRVRLAQQHLDDTGSN